MISATQEQLVAPTGQPKMTTAELHDLLHAHFIRPEDRLSQAGAGAVYLTEVTAPGGNRRADAVHIGLWQSRGAGRIDVCELKTSRSDFRRELDQPAKAEAWWPYSTTFSIVAPSTDIAPPEELPPGWGLLVPKATGRRFQTVVKPAERQPTLTLDLLVTLLKCTETTRTNALQTLRSDLATKAYQREQEMTRTQETRSMSPHMKKRLELLGHLEEVLGERIDNETWMNRLSATDAAETLRAFAAGQKALTESRKEMERRIREFERIKESMTRAAADLRSALSSTPTGEAA